MARTRLALLACLDTREGVWSRARGNESAVKIIGLGEGEYVEIEIRSGPVHDSMIYRSPGVFSLPWKDFDQYRISKFAGNGVRSSTTVEVILS